MIYTIKKLREFNKKNNLTPEDISNLNSIVKKITKKIKSGVIVLQSNNTKYLQDEVEDMLTRFEHDSFLKTTHTFIIIKKLNERIS